MPSYASAATAEGDGVEPDDVVTPRVANMSTIVTCDLCGLGRRINDDGTVDVLFNLASTNHNAAEDPDFEIDLHDSCLQRMKAGPVLLRAAPQ
jgi:hypothetical protein